MPFIDGLPRSGTTLLRMMLDAHPDLAITPGTKFIPQLCAACHNSPDPHATFIHMVASSDTNPRWHDWQIDTEALQHVIYAIQPFHLANALRELYGLYSQISDKSRAGDKTPAYSVSMRLIQSILPEAYFIHLIRDGRAQWWAPPS